MTRDYSTAIQLLNSLQSNAAVLDALRASGNSLNKRSLPEMRHFLQRIGYQPSDLSKLNVIHVAGTKGKGSTSAFCESILRQCRIQSPDGSWRALRTGLYSSPHLQEARERIRIQGVPLSREVFSKYFFSVWDRLESSKKPTDTLDKPGYFRYLTLMSFHAFLQENVDVVICEVGVGGEYDATNILEEPLVTGITALGFDHVDLLGGTIDSIAWHKAGIMKKNVPVFSVRQAAEAEKVIEERSKERETSKLDWIREDQVKTLENIKLGLPGVHQKTNAALAEALCKEWVSQMKARRGVELDGLDFHKGLESARWPGRAQKLAVNEYPDIQWFIDGAHTPESIDVCAKWYETESAETPKDVDHFLIFNCTNGRDASKVLPPLISVLKKLNLKKVIFCPNQPYSTQENTASSDLTNRTVHSDPQLKTQQGFAETWKKQFVTDDAQESPAVLVVPSAHDAVLAVANHSSAAQKRVLVTGSLHLLGSLLSVLKYPVE